jgi:hypothetical protein
MRTPVRRSTVAAPELVFTNTKRRASFLFSSADIKSEEENGDGPKEGEDEKGDDHEEVSFSLDELRVILVSLPLPNCCPQT